jgi:hypothetical protein
VIRKFIKTLIKAFLLSDVIIAAYGSLSIKADSVVIPFSPDFYNQSPFDAAIMNIYSNFTAIAVVQIIFILSLIIGEKILIVDRKQLNSCKRNKN